MEIEKDKRKGMIEEEPRRKKTFLFGSFFIIKDQMLIQLVIYAKIWLIFLFLLCVKENILEERKA